MCMYSFSEQLQFNHHHTAARCSDLIARAHTCPMHSSPAGSLSSHGHSSTWRTAGAHRRLLLAFARAAPAAVAVMACEQAGAAHAAGRKAPAGPRYPHRVQAVLAHLQDHPMTVTSLAMQYDAEPTTPLPECVQGLTPADVLPPQRGSSTANSSGSDHMARVVAGLLYAACGGLDAAHNLVTPLCWGSWTPYAGSPVANSPAAAEAAYVHAIVHRQEGRCIGEFGSGFSNANYWYRAAGEHPVGQELWQAAQALAAGRPKCEAHVAKHGGRWQHSRFVALCDEVAGSRDAELTAFCEGVMAAELQQLLRWCYARM